MATIERSVFLANRDTTNGVLLLNNCRATVGHCARPLDAIVRRIHYHGVNMAFPCAISTGVMRSPIGKTRIPEVKGLQDFVGINYYSVDTVRFDIRNSKELFGRRYAAGP